MIMQVEDYIDCLKAINGESYQYLFLFDHSNGHDRAAADALKPESIRKTYSGQQPKMQDTTIADASYLGPFQHSKKLNIGDIQHMTYSVNDTGPYYLTPEECEKQKFDRVVGTKLQKYTKPDLIMKLKAKGVRNPKGGMKKLQKMCKANDIAITREVPNIDEGWLDKPKGALQVLFERGWIDPNTEPKEYTMKGKVDEFGNYDTDKSLMNMISQQPDFMHEKTMLQHYCEELGIRSNRTPKAHCEIAGEGIEFDWGFSKLTYCTKPIALKRNKTKFH